MRNLRILYLVLAVFGLLIPFSAQADNRHHRHGGHISIYGNGWYFNYGNPPVYQTFYPPPVYYQPPPAIYIQQPRQQVRVCNSTIYYTQTPSGLVAHQNCWMEWR